MTRTLAALAALLAVTTLTVGRAHAQQRRQPVAPPVPQSPAGFAQAWGGAENEVAAPVIGPEYQMLGRIFQDTEHFKSPYVQDQILPALVAKYPPVYGFKRDFAQRYWHKFSYGAPLGCDWMTKALLALGADQGVRVETVTTSNVSAMTRAVSSLKGQDYLLLRCCLAGYVPSLRPDLVYAGLLRNDASLYYDNLSQSRWVFRIGVQKNPTNFSDIVTATDTITVSDQTGREWKQGIGELWAWLMQTPEFYGRTHFLHGDQDPTASHEMDFRYEFLIVHIPEKAPVQE